MVDSIRDFSKERRLFQRIKVDLPARINDVATGRLIRVKTYDISAQGVGILSEERLDKATPVKISVSVPHIKRRPLTTYGRVIWVKPETRFSWRIGLSLEKPEFAGLSSLLRD